jgi:hypothetical protein
VRASALRRLPGGAERGWDERGGRCGSRSAERVPRSICSSSCASSSRRELDAGGLLGPGDPRPAGLVVRCLRDELRLLIRSRDRFRLDAELRRLAAARDRWDGLVGHLAMLMKMADRLEPLPARSARADRRPGPIPARPRTPPRPPTGQP